MTDSMWIRENDDDDLVRGWIDDRYQELLEWYPSASGGPCHTALDDGNHNLIYSSMLMAAMAIVRKFIKEHDMPLGFLSHPTDDVLFALNSCSPDLYDEYPTDMLMASYLCMKNMVDVLGRETLENL